MLRSSARKSIRSPQSTSIIEPVDTKALNPTFSRRLQSRTDVHSAPLWLRNATFPAAPFFLTRWRSNLARESSPQGNSARASAFFRGKRRSLLQVSTLRNVFFKAGRKITAPLTPASAHSLTTSGTVTAGVAIIARSTGFGTASTWGKPRPRGRSFVLGLSGR